MNLASFRGFRNLFPFWFQAHHPSKEVPLGWIVSVPKKWLGNIRVVEKDTQFQCPLHPTPACTLVHTRMWLLNQNMVFEY